MKQSDYALLEQYMQSCIVDAVHDAEHIYRVLDCALDIAQTESGVDYDVLITACLLHDIGRPEQFADSAVCHAQAGAQKAHRFLLDHGFDPVFAERVTACIETHRFRTDRPPVSLEARILFDADKVDVAGLTGIARTLAYQGYLSIPLYRRTPDGTVSDGSADQQPSFFHEYKFKLENLYDRFYTARGRALAAERQQTAAAFYRDLLGELRTFDQAAETLAAHLTP